MACKYPGQDYLQLSLPENVHTLVFGLSQCCQRLYVPGNSRHISFLGGPHLSITGELGLWPYWDLQTQAPRGLTRQAGGIIEA